MNYYFSSYFFHTPAFFLLQSYLKGILPNHLLVKKSIKAAVEKKCKTILIAGGVAANSELRKRLFEAGKEKEIEVYEEQPVNT